MTKLQKVNYHILSQWYDPEYVFDTLFAEDKISFWLDSSLTNKTNRFSYMGTPDETYSYFLKNSGIIIKKKKKITNISQDIFTFLETKLKDQVISNHKLPFNFQGGFVGYFGYEIKALIDGKALYRSPYPDSLWFLINNFLAFDHHEKKVYLVSLAKSKKETDMWFEKIMRKVTNNKKAQSSLVSNIRQKKLLYHFSKSKKEYLKDLQKCKEFLKKGESYQICYTNSMTTTADVDPLLLYKTLRRNNPAPYSAFIKYDSLAILSSSPEQFLKIDKDRMAQTKPIKGTIKRGQTKSEDETLKRKLIEGKKEWSENAMIVDLLRNDLGRVSEFGSVKVTKLMAIESYETVHQLVSTIVGKLRPEISIINCIKACFPGGSMTGTPKIRAMEILDELENQARGVYSGTLGFLSFNQTAELSIVIRTIVKLKKQITIGSGGAILIDSDPESEYDEMLLKTKALVDSIEKAVYTTPMHTVFLALGTNIGNKKQNIHNAVDALKEKVANIQVANLYETKPMYFEKQEMFLNTVIKGQTDLKPEELLKFVKSLENKLGRQKRFRNGPREIDIDILFYDQLKFENTDVVIPHPRIQEREFVLQPFMDLDPEFIHPVLKKTMKEIYNELKQT